MLVAFTAANAQEVIKNDITSDTKWTSDKVYVLDGIVFVKNNAKLTIEAGTVIKGLRNEDVTADGEDASALVITRGSQIFANGTSSKPIIFTSEVDDVNDPDDLDLSDPDLSRGLWGGLIVLGNAPIGGAASEESVEGLPVMDDTKYGGNVEDDNSGSLTFISIRHGGAELSADNEINGLTLGGVGNKTVIEHVEVMYNLDDGIEFFGGSVNVKYAAVSFCRDDAFDWDLGWRGKGQFWLALSAADAGDHGGELDGAKPDDNARFSNPEIFNYTFIGGGVDGTAKNEHAIILRDGSAGTLANGIITEYTSYALEVEDRNESYDSYSKMKDGDLKLLNNFWYGFGVGSTWDEIILATPEKCDDCSKNALKQHLNENNNELAMPGIRSISRTNDGKLNPHLTESAAANKAGATPSSDWFKPTSYIGAFSANPAESWLGSWTGLSAYGFLESAIKYSSVNTIATLNGVEVYPNPATNAAIVSFNNIESDNITVRVLDLSGKIITTVASKNFAIGNNKVTVNTADLTTGLYIIELSSANGTHIEKLMVR